MHRIVILIPGTRWVEFIAACNYTCVLVRAQAKSFSFIDVHYVGYTCIATATVLQS